MRALWITTSLCLASTAVLAQPASPTAVGLDTCFKLVRVAEANCSNSADNAAQRPACIQERTQGAARMPRTRRTAVPCVG